MLQCRDLWASGPHALEESHEMFLEVSQAELTRQLTCIIKVCTGYFISILLCNI